MAAHHLVRIGALGNVGRFVSVDATRYPRRTRVVVRTRRGLEMGEVLARADDVPPATSQEGSDGEILRGMTPQDELLAERLERHRRQALESCAALLAERRLDAVLLDVEHLFDGQGLYFYFLGDVSPEVEALTAQLAEAYESKVQFRRFTETLLAGCGPDCGSEAAGGGGCSDCSGCSVAAACGPRDA